MAELIKGFQTNEGTKQYDYNALANKPTLITQSQIEAVLNQAKEYTDEKIEDINVGNNGGYVTEQELQDAVTSALTQAKQNGDFKGDMGPKPEKGVDYWTVQDQQDIINSVLSKLPTWEGGEY